MKNHFYIGYSGNKRNECKKLYEMLDLREVKTFIEPFCGTCAVSYYIWLQKPELKFILNDENIFLKEMYEIYKDEIKIDEFNNEYNNLIIDITKEKYNILIRNNNVMSWFLRHKIYNIRPGLFPIIKAPLKNINLRTYPIYNFFKNADIEFKNMDGVKLIEDYKNNDDIIIFLDPPYLNTCNQFYIYENININMNIYEYLYNNSISNFKCKIYGIFEDNWIIKMIFKDHIKNNYDKTYSMSKKKTSHLTISNI